MLEKTKSLVAEERRLTTEVLWHLAEIKERRLYAEMGFSSLFEYAVKELVLSLQGKSRRECEKELLAKAPQLGISVPMSPFHEREKVVSPALTEIRLLADDALLEKLKRIRELDSHVTAGASYLELFHRMADIALKKLDPIKTQTPEKRNPESRTGTPPAQSNDAPLESPAWVKPESPKHSARKIRAHFKREIWIRDQGRCTYVADSGQRCGSRFGLEIDHRRSVAHGGHANLENLRLLCRTHNVQEAINNLGIETMALYIGCGTN